MAEAQQTEQPAQENGTAPAPDPDLANRLKSELEALRLKLPNCKTVHDYQVLTEQVNNVAKAAAAACRRRANREAEAAAPPPGEAAAAPAPAPAAAAAAGRQGRHTFAANSVLGLLPAEDDGLTCLLVRLPKGWGTPRLQAFIERFSVKPEKVEKNVGETHSLVVFSKQQDRAQFVEELRRAEQDKSSSAGLTGGQFIVKLPGAAAAAAAAGAGGGGSNTTRQERPAGGGDADGDGDGDAAAAVAAGGAGSSAGGGAGGKRAAAGGEGQQQQQHQQQQGGGVGRPSKVARVDIRESVCPWWSRPYQDQLKDKMSTVRDLLRQLTERVSASYGRGGVKPAWLTSALSRHGKMALPLPGILRSPQLNGYRNKAEFTLGLDGAERPLAGFLLGLYVDGLTQVADPSECRHISPTCLAYAAAMTSFLRSSSNSLPVWDKRSNKGFWRLLVAREGRAPTFLPLPVPPAAAAADGSSSSSAGGVLPPCPLAEVPLQKWFVRDPVAARAAAAAAAADVEVTMEDLGQLGQEAAAAADGADEQQQQQLAAALDLSGGMDLDQVTEVEPATPKPSQVMVMLQVDPTAAGSAEQLKEQLTALAAHLQEVAAQQGLPLTSLLVQHHSGVSNAAPANAPIMLCPGFTSSSTAAAATAAAAAASGDAAAAAAAVNEAGSFNDSLCELTFRVSPTAFYQVNPGSTCLLYHAAGRLAAVGPDTLLLDVCCGTGTIGLTLARQVAAVIGIEMSEAAIQDAHRNAQINNITNATFICGKAEAVIDQVLAEHIPQYKHVVAVVDPPRAGLHRNVVLALLGCEAIRRVVYVSCNPASLVNNGQYLCGAYKPQVPAGRAGNKGGGRGGNNRGHQRQQGSIPVAPYTPFRPTQVLAFDMFPHTAHVETLMLLERD